MPEVKDYTEKDLEAALRRAFVDRESDFIIFDGHEARNEFLRDGINYGLENEWVYGNEVEEEQWTTIKYRLTDKGKKHFGLD